ncbi:MAG: polysaccharide biosynthesis/export family protein [Nitrospira sp.]|nr:polysaccharide biosynthesis/export family protein [Nitrospira sp.]
MRGMRHTMWVVLFMVFCVAGGAEASETESAAAPAAEAGWSGPFRLGAGDVLNVFIWKHKELSTIVTVRPDGKINYPLIGEIEAKGLTLGEIEERINKQLKNQIQDPQVTVILEATHSFRIFVLGEVMQPGVFDLKGPVTVIQALAMARGLTTFASRNKIFIVNPARGNEQRIPFSYSKFVQGEDTNQNVLLRPGDTVIVP